ncbi:conserved hypothetical protein [Azospirillaceae bacterium]
MPLPEKLLFALPELSERWSLPIGDLGIFALEGILTLAIVVNNLAVSTDNDDAIRRCGSVTGIVSVDGLEAWPAFKGETVTLTRVRVPGGSLERLSEQARLRITQSDLYISRDEKRRFEIANRLDGTGAPAVPDAGKARSRAGVGPSHDWDAFWIELCDHVYKEGRPETQAELIRHMLEWLAIFTDKIPDESTVRKKVQRYWRKSVVN